MTTTTSPTAPAATTDTPRGTGFLRFLAVLVLLGAVVLTVGGAATWALVQTSLAGERITVSEDAAWFAGDAVDGPLTAYVEADTIEKHALEASGGRTYAELDREDPVRDTVMTASFLRASLLTSVVSFGVAALAAGLGVLFLLTGVALLRVSRRVARA